MIKKMIISLLIIFFISSISASCNETQIDINSASLEELDKIITVGPATAAKIVSARSFSSLDDLIRVKGIGNITLEKIKSQELACVGDNKENDTEETPISEVNESVIIPINEPKYTPENFSMPKIIIDTQTIKSQVNEQENSKINFAIYGLAGFSILLATLFAIKKLRKNKNEFRE